MGSSKIMKKEKKIDFLKEYTNFKNPGSYSGAQSFYRSLKQT